MEDINNFKGVLMYIGPKAVYTDADVTNIVNNSQDILDYVILDIDSDAPDSTEVLSMAKSIYSTNHNLRIWIGTPFYNYKKRKSYDFIKESVDNIKSTFMNDATGCIIWNNCVKGIYLNMESIYDTIYRNELKERGIIQSISRKGNCYDNCIMETFFGRMKNEMYYGCEKDYSSFEEFSKAVEEYIDYYNNKRIQAKTKWMPPAKYRKASMCSV